MAEPEALIAIALGAVNLAGLIWAAGYKLGKLELQVNTLWDIIIKDAVTEGVRSKLLKRSSPVAPDMDRVDEVLSDLIDELRRNTTIGKIKNPMQRCIALERQYGEALKEISIEKGVPYTGLLILVQVLFDSGEVK